MSFKVLFPGRLYGRFEGKDKDLLKPHSLCKLIGSESLAEAHLTVPKELRTKGRILLDFLFEVVLCYSDRFLLFRAHAKAISPSDVQIDGRDHNSHDSGSYILRRAAEPFTIYLLDTTLFEHSVNGMVSKAAAISIKRRHDDFDLIRLFVRREKRRIVLVHSDIDRTHSIPDL